MSGFVHCSCPPRMRGLRGSSSIGATASESEPSSAMTGVRRRENLEVKESDACFATESALVQYMRPDIRSS
jgi:hypothetical protein